MSPLVIPLIGIGAILTILWALAGGSLLVGSRKVRPLSAVLQRDEKDDIAESLPSLSVVVTARDEAEQIGATLRSLLQQRYPSMQIIAVNDRSSDETPRVLDRLVEEPEAGPKRLQIIHVDALPQGWTGKCHACHLGAECSSGSWMLFTDGDVCFTDERLLAGVVAYAERCGLDHLAVIPDLRPMSAVQAGLVALFGQMFLTAARAHEMDRDLQRGGIGVGAFNLVRRAAYDRIGGHHLLKMDLADDVKLGRLLKESGARQRLFNGLEVVRCRWHRGAFKVLRGLEKNFFAVLGYSLPMLIAWTAVLLGLNYGPAMLGAAAMALSWKSATPNISLAAWMPFAVQGVLVSAAYFFEARRYGYHPLTLSLLHPLSVLLLLAAAWNSAIRTLARGGVCWRDTFYPLKQLRAGLVRAGARVAETHPETRRHQH